MKCTFRFKAAGRMRLSSSDEVTESPSVPTQLGTYAFRSRGGAVTEVDVTVQLDPSQWPQIVGTPGSGESPEIRPNLPHLPFIQEDLKSLQGLLSLFGLESIDWKEPEIFWIPETEEERKALPIFSCRMSEEPHEAGVPVPFDIIARAALAAHTTSTSQVPLNFYRRGVKDYSERAYVDAIFDFYFVIETLYADGKFRTSHVKEKFKQSTELMDCVRVALEQPPPPAHAGAGIRAEYDRNFGSIEPEGLIDFMIDLRGKLHHHNMKDVRRPWHPEEQDLHRVSAIMFMSVAMAVVGKFIDIHLYDSRVLSAYEAIRNSPTDHSVGDKGNGQATSKRIARSDSDDQRLTDT